MEGKKCTVCKKWKPYAKFSRDSHKKNGYRSECGSCQALRQANKRIVQSERVLKLEKARRPKDKDKHRDRVRKRRGIKLKAKGSFTTEEFNIVIKNFDNRCYYCAKKISVKMHPDHFIALARGGHNDISNIVPACPTCNLSKGAKMPWEFKAGESFNPKLPEQWRQENA